MSLSTIVLNASILYNAFIAQHVGVQNNQVVLDLRNTDVSTQGIIITDPIAPTDQDIVDAYTIRQWVIQTNAKIPKGTSLQLFAKTGDSYFTETDWTDWRPIDLNHTLTSPSGRYLKLKYIFTTTDPSLSPKVTDVTVQAHVKNTPFERPLKITQQHNEALVTSSYSFDYEHQDEPTIQSFIETHNLRDLIANKKTDLERLVALNHYIAQLPNTRHNMWSEAYPWTLDQVILQEGDQPAVKGHCMSYASVLVSTLTGLGYHARHWAIEGF
ncbi:MAG: transglutaminase domain-containing protein, partial [Candidatus Latescibacteria bacterium]|nr:transglutaminase domain-containing protein [Candidatus Latescibacterota bacterium]